MNSNYPSRTADKFVVRLPDGLRDSIQGAADYLDTSMNTVFVQAVRQYLDTQQRQQLLLDALAKAVSGKEELDAVLHWRDKHTQAIRERDALQQRLTAADERADRLEADKQAMTETHVLYTWLRKKCDQPSNDVVAVHMNIGHDWATVRDLDTDLRAMIEREEP